MSRAAAAGFFTLAAAALAALLAAVPAPTASAAESCRPGFPDHLNFRFCADSGGWFAGFADLPADQLEGDLFELSFRRARVPHAPAADRRLLGLRVSGHNRSDDLFMYVKRQLTGLAPNAAYAIDLRFTLYTNAGRGCVGIGGAPGEAVYVKAGAVPYEPKAVEDEVGDLRMNLDKGNQSQGGDDAAVLGDLAAAGANCGGTVYVPKRFVATGPDALVGETDRDGNLWVLIGTDSGFEGRTTWYVTHIRLAVRRL